MILAADFQFSIFEHFRKVLTSGIFFDEMEGSIFFASQHFKNHELLVL